MADLGQLPGSLDTDATDVSADGSVVVGTSANLACRWTSGRGMQPSPSRPAPRGPGRAPSPGAAVIAGFCVVGSDGPATYWDASGPHDLMTLLGSTRPAGWALQTINAISDDGRTFVGNSVHNGSFEGFIATIPAPGAAPLLGMALGLAARRRGRVA